MSRPLDATDVIETLEENVRETAAASEQPKYDNLQNYLGTELKVAGLRSPQISDIYNQMQFPASFSVADKMNFWEEVWFRNEWFELMSMALLFIRKQGKKLPPDFLLERLVLWEDRIDNWAHSDELAHALATLLPDRKNEMLSILSNWNNDVNPWKRRQSVVAPIRIRQNIGTHLDWNELNRLILPLIKDGVYFVQKGVGWALREAGMVYPEKLQAFLTENCATLPSPAFATAVEKVPLKEKEIYKSIRRKSRLNR